MQFWYHFPGLLSSQWDEKRHLFWMAKVATFKILHFLR